MQIHCTTHTKDLIIFGEPTIESYSTTGDQVSVSGSYFSTDDKQDRDVPS